MSSTSLKKQSLDLSQPKAPWYKECDFCKFHHVEGHLTLKCIQLKDYGQDLIDRKEILMGEQASLNEGLLIYQNVFPQHNNKTWERNLCKTTIPTIKIIIEQKIPNPSKQIIEIDHNITLQHTLTMVILIDVYHRMNPFLMC